MFFEEINPEIVYESRMLKHKTNSYFNAYERDIIILILFVSPFLGLISKAEEYKTEQNIAYEVLNNKANFKDDMGSNFLVCSQAFVKKSGSSFGTLIAFSFMNISKNLKGKRECNHDDIVNIFKTTLKISAVKVCSTPSWGGQ